MKRLRTKATTLNAYGMEAQEGIPAALLTENSQTKNQVYLVTVSHPTQTHSASGIALRAPSSYDHQFLLAALLDACRHPKYDAGNQSKSLGGVRLLRCLVAAEYHKTNGSGDQRRHYHVALQAFNSFRFIAVKRALSEKYGGLVKPDIVFFGEQVITM